MAFHFARPRKLRCRWIATIRGHYTNLLIMRQRRMRRRIARRKRKALKELEKQKF